MWSPSQLCDSHYICTKLFILKNYMRWRTRGLSLCILAKTQNIYDWEIHEVCDYDLPSASILKNKKSFFSPYFGRNFLQKIVKFPSNFLYVISSNYVKHPPKTFSKSSSYHCLFHCFHRGGHIRLLEVGLSNITGLSAGRVPSLLSTSFTSLSGQTRF